MTQGGRRLALLLVAAFGIALLVLSVSVFAATTLRVTQALAAEQAPRALGLPEALAMLSAALAVASSTLASGLALRQVAAAGFAAAAENPRLATWILIMGGLAEGIAIYGLLVAIFILGKI